MDIKEVKINNQASINGTINKLKSELKSLIQNAQWNLEDLEKQGENASINSLGIFQQQANSIDNLCGRLGALKNDKELLDNIKE